jgi:type III secretion system FlhB-like substrate exporter
VPPGEDIPGDLYLALAEVLAFVYGVSDERPPPES